MGFFGSILSAAVKTVLVPVAVVVDVADVLVSDEPSDSVTGKLVTSIVEDIEDATDL